MNTVPLGEVASVFNGKTPGKSDQRTSGHPVLKIRDIDQYGSFTGEFGSFVEEDFAQKHRGRWAEVGDTLILNAAHQASHVASKLALVAPDAAGSLLTGEWLVIRPTGTKVDPGYLHYWISSERVRRAVRDMVKGIHLYPRDVARLQIDLPPLDEQRRIAAILDQAGHIRTNQRQVATHLAGLAEAIFVDMFGDPDEALVSRSVVRFGEVADLQGGRNLVADDQDTISEFRVLKISAVTSGQFKPSESKALPAGYVPPADHLVRQGDLLISRANTAELVGAVAYVADAPSNLVLPDKVWRFVWRNPDSVPLYYRSLFRTSSIRRRISQLASGTGGSMKNISKAKLVELELPAVTFAQQREFARRVEVIPRPAHSQTDELMSSLQSRAFAGRL